MHAAVKQLMGDAGSEAGSEGDVAHEELSREDIKCWLRSDVLQRCEQLCLDHGGKCVSEAVANALLADAEAKFDAHVHRREARPTVRWPLRLKQEAAKGAVMKALPAMLFKRDMMQRKKVGSSSRTSSPLGSTRASRDSLSEYEQKRLTNIKANRNMLLKLGLVK